MQSPQDNLNKKDGINFILRAFRHRNYRLFFMGQGTSLIGTWMQAIAVSWLVYRLTGSAFLLGLVGFVSQIPTFIFGPIGGVVSDRTNRRSLLLITQSLATIQAFLLAWLTLSNRVTVSQIIYLSVFLGLVNSFDIPLRQAFVADIVEDKKDLGNAVALNALMFNSARLIGPSIAGILIAFAGEGVCFLINGLSFFAVIISLKMITIKPKEISIKASGIWKDLKEGVLYAARVPRIRYVLILVSLISLMGMSYAVLMPVFAKDILKGGPQTLGLLMGSVGLGALLGSIYLASKKSHIGLEEVISKASIVFGIGLIAFSLSRMLWFSIIIIFIVGVGLILQLTSSNTILQNITDDDKRGRVMSLYAVCFMGMAPIGSLLCGFVASKLGAQATVLLSGLLCILTSFILKIKIRPAVARA